MNTDLEEKINSMSYEELVSFSGVASTLNFIINILGIGSILFVLNVPGIFTIIAGAVVVHILSGISVVVSQTKRYVAERIKKLKR